MFKKGMDNRGQISAEYLLLLVVTLVILSFVTIPLVTRSVDASNDVSNVAAAKNTVDSIANAVDIVYANGPGAKRTVKVYVPRDNMPISRGGKSINMTYFNPADGTNKTVIANTSYSLGGVYTYAYVQGWYNVNVTWTAGANYIGVTFSKV